MGRSEVTLFEYWLKGVVESNKLEPVEDWINMDALLGKLLAIAVIGRE